uniref:Bacterial EndoU nuclease domain-containing protein n=3 Tax=Moraxella bovis TaxID=476 RepID=Q5KTB5_MORBO|nr:hypothetical protein [Moraxella bovis Epp63]
MAKAIQDYPEIGAVLDAYQKGEYHNLALSQEALQALSDATGISTEVLLTSITAQRGIQGGTNKTLTVIDTHNELRQDSIQTLGHELDHIRGGKNETLADLAGLAAKLNTDAAIIANQDTINPIKAQLGDGKDAQTTAQNQALLEGNDKTFVENHDGREGEWEYIIRGVDTEEYEDGSSKIVRTYYAERHNVYNWQARRIYDEYKKFFAQNNIDESQVSLELKKQLILDLMKEYGVSDSTFSAFEGNDFIISDDNNVVTDTLVNQTSKNYKDEFMEDILSGDVLDNTQYDKLKNDALFFNRINNSIEYEQFKSNVIEKTEKYALPAAQIVGGGAQIIAATGIEVVGCGASYGTLCIPATALAALLIADGSDNVFTGLSNITKQPDEQTVSFVLTQIYGLSETDANTVKLLVGSASAGGELGVAVNASKATNSAMATNTLTQAKATEPVIAINITDVENRLKDLGDVGLAYRKMPEEIDVNSVISPKLIDEIRGQTNSKSTQPSEQFTLQGNPYLTESATPIDGTTVKLNSDFKSQIGELPKGTVVTVSDNAFKATLPDGTIYRGDSGQLARQKALAYSQATQQDFSATIPYSTISHADIGEFNSRNRLIGGGHGQSNIEYLDNNNIPYNIVHEYPNGVRIGNIPSHKSKSKTTGTGQAWFPKNWDEKKIQAAGEYVNKIHNTLPDGQWAFATYDGVRVGIIKNNGVVGTIIPDNSRQP